MGLVNFWFQLGGIHSANLRPPQRKIGEPCGSPSDCFLLFESQSTQKMNLALSCICRMLVAVVVYVLKFAEENWLT